MRGTGSLGRLRVASAVLGLVGVAVVIWLLAAPPSLALRDLQGVPGTEPSAIVECYSLLQLPDGLPRSVTVVDTDAVLNGVDSGSQFGDSIRLHNYCERLRSSRLAYAVLVAMPSVILVAVAVSGPRRGDKA